MIEIRFHGRGGQGSVVGAQLLAEAAFCEGKHVQAFPYFGVERRGAPVTAYTRISSTPIRMRTNIYNPNHVVVMDPTLIDVVDVAEGLRDDGWLIVNTMKHPSELEIKHPHIGTVDATHIARKYGLGSKNAPIVNTAILGAVVRATSIVSIEDLLKSIRYKAPAKAEENAKAAQEAHDSLKVGE